jgi:high-affinity K+ transport system ATPase subunit B
LQQEGIKVIMFTGDNEDTARAVSATFHLDGFKAQMLPEDKLNEIKILQAEGKRLPWRVTGSTMPRLYRRQTLELLWVPGPT